MRDQPFTHQDSFQWTPNSGKRMKQLDLSYANWVGIINWRNHSGELLSAVSANLEHTRSQRPKNASHMTIR